MKKKMQSPRRPLSLSRESLRALTEHGQRVNGGVWQTGCLCPRSWPVFCPPDTWLICV